MTDPHRNPRLKHTAKRPKFTSESFHETKNKCGVCGGNHFFAEQPMPRTNYFYRSYGYQTKRVQWRIKCANSKCSQPYGVILKLEYQDSAGG